jgi:hypothetical protein
VTLYSFSSDLVRQANLDLYESGIVPLVVQSIPEGAAVASVYSGIGILGINALVSGRASSVHCVDPSPFAESSWARTAAHLPLVHISSLL